VPLSDLSQGGSECVARRSFFLGVASCHRWHVTLVFDGESIWATSGTSSREFHTFPRGLS
jgi:hypothetical protein